VRADRMRARVVAGPEILRLTALLGRLQAPRPPPLTRIHSVPWGGLPSRRRSSVSPRRVWPVGVGVGRGARARQPTGRRGAALTPPAAGGTRDGTRSRPP
jgi:hypothetical protein